MRFSIQVQDEPKMFFHVIPAAEKATGLSRQTIRDVLERGNKVYHRQSDHKLFAFSKEDPILIAKIEGEDFFSLEEIHEKLGLTPTKFLNQIKKNKFAKKIDWISDELFPEKLQQEEAKAKKPDELEEMKSQFEKFREEMKSQFEKLQEEIERLSSRVETLEATNEKEKASPPAEVSPSISQEAKPTVFKASGTFSRYAFNIESLAKFIRNGFVCEIRPAGPKTHGYVLVNEKREYLPNLVKQIIQNHILPEFVSETEEEREKFIFGYTPKNTGMSLGAFSAIRGQLRRLEPTFISEVSKKVMTLI